MPGPWFRLARRRRPASGLAMLLGVAVLAATACTGTPAPGGSAAAPPTSNATVGVAPASDRPASAAPSSTGSVRATSPVVVEAPDGGSLLVHGTYPRVRSRCVRPVQPTLDARYPGTLSVSRADDGTLTLTVKLPFERYLQGIAEVPPSWPQAALEAQAIAARTYALAQTGWRGTSGERLRAPICATTSCQVYRGLPVNPEADIGRWYAAVNRTAGRVLLFGGRPADTLYFSTSNGRTYGNDQVFGTAPLPYLRPVSERDDRASPESHWRTAIPLPQLTRFLRAAGAWPAGAGVTDVARRGDAIEVSGHGVSRSLGVDAFRTDVNAWAPCLAPRRYPQPSRTGTPLPVTVPSGWFRLSQAGGAAVLNGRGWGHGVGMVQWGAYGKAERGLSADRILAAYYGGLRPQPFPEPGTIRVQVADGVRSVSIGSSGAGAFLDGRRIGPSTVTIRAAVGGGLTVSVRPAP